MASINQIRVGTSFTVTANFTDLDGVAANPTTVKFQTIDPNNDEATYTFPDATISNPTVGEFVFTLPTATTVSGCWYVYSSGLGNGVTVADEIAVTVAGAHVTI